MSDDIKVTNNYLKIVHRLQPDEVEPKPRSELQFVFFDDTTRNGIDDAVAQAHAMRGVDYKERMDHVIAWRRECGLENGGRMETLVDGITHDLSRR